MTMTTCETTALLRRAFDAGMEQGGEEARAYEWGQGPGQSADEAFADFLEREDLK
jgi:hypothetical protein